MKNDNTAYGNELTLILKLNIIYNTILTVNHNNKQLKPYKLYSIISLKSLDKQLLG